MPSDTPQAGVDYPRSFHELTSWFGDEEACLCYLERVRWADGFVCRFCGTVGGEWWAVRRGLRRCAVCRRETSVTAGTVFHGSRLPLVSWFAAVWSRVARPPLTVSLKKGTYTYVCTRAGPRRQRDEG